MVRQQPVYSVVDGGKGRGDIRVRQGREVFGDCLRDAGGVRLMLLMILSLASSSAVANVTEQHINSLHEIDRAINDAIHSGDINAYLQNNKDFHFGIYELADSPVLMRIAQSLWLQVGPSLRFVCGRYGTANLPDKHADILGALLNQNTELAASAMREDLEQGVMFVAEPSAAIFDQNYSKSQ